MSLQVWGEIASTNEKRKIACLICFSTKIRRPEVKVFQFFLFSQRQGSLILCETLYRKSYFSARFREWCKIRLVQKGTIQYMVYDFNTCVLFKTMKCQNRGFISRTAFSRFLSWFYVKVSFVFGPFGWKLFLKNIVSVEVPTQL